MQAIMLAAGMGSRLGKYTKDNTKCMLDVYGKTLLERAIDSLLNANINKLILVLGYKKENVKKYIKETKLDEKIEIEFIDNDVYDKTNNIYSLYLAKDKLIQDDTILLESDLIYDESIISELVNSKYNDAALVAKYEEWMDGTMVTLNEDKVISSFVEKNNFDYNEVNSYYKTVNIYKFSKDFCKRFYLPFLESYIKAYGHNDYYELVLKVISGLKDAKLYGVVLDGKDWYEIDDCQDYDIVKAIFAPTTKEKLELFHKRFGGYWRFNGIKDYCYLVNPYFPTKQLISKMKYFYEDLLFNYPSGQKVERIIATRFFENVSDENIIIGNGAAELINLLRNVVGKRIALTIPSFNEYVRCFPNSEFVFINSKDNGYRLSLESLINVLDDVDTLVVISPDNPSGSHLSYDETIKLLNIAKQKEKQIVFDESFIDFASDNYTLIDDSILKRYENLIVIKSISKSYGVPGLRLGILASGNNDIINILNNNLPVWNINSFAEYFLQIFNIYKKDYKNACINIKNERDRFYNELRNIKELYVYPSEANYFMIELKKGKAYELAEFLLNNKKILIKVLNGKNGFDSKEYIRIAIKDKEENDYLFDCLKEYFGV